MLVNILAQCIAGTGKREALKILSACRLVCSEWNDLASDASLPFYALLSLQIGDFEVLAEEIKDDTFPVGTEERYLYYRDSIKPSIVCNTRQNQDTEQNNEKWVSKSHTTKDHRFGPQYPGMVWWDQQDAVAIMYPDTVQFLQADSGTLIKTYIPSQSYNTELIDCKVACGNLYISIYERSSNKSTSHAHTPHNQALLSHALTHI